MKFEPVKIAYDETERGWAIPLDAQGSKLRIDNVPFGTTVRFRDVVTAKWSRTLGMPLVDAVLERPLPLAAKVKYMPSTQERYIEVRKAFEAVGATAEGAYMGLASINAPAGTDLGVVAKQLGVELKMIDD